MKKNVPILILLAAAGFTGAGLLHDRILEQRREMLPPDLGETGNVPPAVAFTTVALGGFRGLIADALWLRLSRLQQEGRYFEIAQLAGWITRLEPRFPTVWGYHAWNMAYNISVQFDRPEDRWRWVRNGIGLLENEGLKYNPGSARICREIGWIFQHKIGGNSDSAHLYYKEQWAEEAPDELKKLEPQLIRQIEKQYGPVDWRSPLSMAVYWAEKGSKTAAGAELVQCRRMVAQSLRQSVFQGRVAENTSELILLPNLDLLPAVLADLEAGAAQSEPDGLLRRILEGFLADSAVWAYLENRPDIAAKLHERLTRLNPGTPSNPAGFLHRAYVGEGTPEQSLTELEQRKEVMLRNGLNIRAQAAEQLADIIRSKMKDE